MGTRKPLDLSALDDKLLDGLRYCTKVYDLFDQIRSEPDGLGKIRLLSSQREKRLLPRSFPSCLKRKSLGVPMGVGQTAAAQESS
jgi:hypothetical protein